MSLPSILAQGSLMPIQRPTLVVAAAAGALALNAVCFLTQPIDIHLQHMGSLQCPPMSLPILLEGFIVLVVSPLGLGMGSRLAAELWSCHSSPPLAFLQHGSDSCLCKQILKEDRMSWMASSLQLGLQGGRPGSLQSRYTLW